MAEVLNKEFHNNPSIVKYTVLMDRYKEASSSCFVCNQAKKQICETSQNKKDTQVKRYSFSYDTEEAVCLYSQPVNYIISW